MDAPRLVRDSYDAYGSVSTFDAPEFRGDMPMFGMSQKPFPLVQRWIVIVYSPPDFSGVLPNTGTGNGGVGPSIEDIESGLVPTQNWNSPAMIQGPSMPSSNGTQSNSVSTGP